MSSVIMSLSTWASTPKCVVRVFFRFDGVFEEEENRQKGGGSISGLGHYRYGPN